MKSYVQLLTELRTVTKQDLNKLESILDSLFSSCGIDIKFTKHFLDRVNNARNKRQITVPELSKIFRGAYIRYCDDFSHMKNVEAILHDLNTDINIPFVLKWNQKEKILDLITKTIMRKKGFKSSNKKFNV